MTHTLINTGSYLLVVSDDETSEVDKITIGDKPKAWYHHNNKILAHLPLNNSPIFEGVDLLPPLEQEDDVEKLAWELYPYNEGIDIETGQPLDYNYGFRYGFVKGYNKAKEKYKFTKEDIDKAYWAGMKFVGEDKGSYEEFIQSLSQPKMPVGFECETLVLRERPTDMRNHIYDKTYEVLKTTTNSQGQTVLVGRYIYE